MRLCPPSPAFICNTTFEAQPPYHRSCLQFHTLGYQHTMCWLEKDIFVCGHQTGTEIWNPAYPEAKRCPTAVSAASYDEDGNLRRCTPPLTTNPLVPGHCKNTLCRNKALKILGWKCSCQTVMRPSSPGGDNGKCTACGAIYDPKNLSHLILYSRPVHFFAVSCIHPSRLHQQGTSGLI